MARQFAHANPTIIRWARESASYDIDTAARRLQVKPQRIQEWESGSKPPTLKQLRKAAAVYRRPFAAFFRTTPPQSADLPTDFRLGATGDAANLTPELAREIRRARFRQRIALELIDEAGDTPPKFSLAVQPQDDTRTAARALRDFIGVPLSTQKRWPYGRETFNNWRTAFESASVLVFQTSKVASSEMRGFSLWSTTLPAVVVNRKDAPAGRIFTLFHELAHLGLGRAGMCDFRGEAAIEQRCNAIASEALVPTDDFEPPSPTDSEVQATANRYGVSAEVIWRRLRDIHVVTDSFYVSKRIQLRERFTVADEERRHPNKGGPPPSRETVSLSGRYYTSIVLSALRSRTITSADAAEYMGLRAKHFDAVAREVGTGSVGA